MVSRLSQALLAVLLVAACSSDPADFTDEHRRAVGNEVRTAVAALTDAMNAHDGERVVSFYVPEPDFVYVGCTDVQIGGVSFARRVKPYYAANPDVLFEQSIVSLRVLAPDAAVVSLRGGSTHAPSLFLTQVWERTDEGGWGISVEHESWPGCSEPAEAHPFTGAPDSLGLQLPGS